MKQIVKNYTFYPGDFRNNVKSVDISGQINHDLKKNPGWSVKLMTFIEDDTICVVVYDIDESNRVLVESKKEVPFIISSENVETSNNEAISNTTTSDVNNDSIKVTI
jgi:hypothetical protein